MLPHIVKEAPAQADSIEFETYGKTGCIAALIPISLATCPFLRARTISSLSRRLISVPKCPPPLASLPAELHAPDRQHVRSPGRTLKARRARHPDSDVCSSRGSKACGTLDYSRRALSPLPVVEQGHRNRTASRYVTSRSKPSFFRLISHFFLRRRGFQKLKAAQLASRRFRFGFGRQFGHHITDLDRTQPLHRELNGPDLHILDALPSLPNLHTIVTPLMSEAVDAVVRGIRIRQRWTIIRSHNGLDGEVSFVTDCFLELSRALARRRSEFFSTSFSVRHSGCTR